MKEKITFTIDKKVTNDFKELSNKKFINRSALVESLLKSWIQTEKENEK